MRAGLSPIVLTASEALTAGNWVNVWNNSGTANVRKADATATGKRCHGFVLASASSSASVTVYFDGINTAVSSQTPGDVFLSTTAGTGGSSPPSGSVGSGNVVQTIGIAISATAVILKPDIPLTL